MGMETVSTSRVTNFRLVMLGAESVGKSSLTLRLVKDEFKDYNPPTIGAAYLNQTFKVGEKIVKLDLWDTAGQERFDSLAPMYYRTAQAAVVTYDLCRRDTFKRALNWLKELEGQAPSDMVILLCGNKVDKCDSREIGRQEGETLAKDNAVLFSEVSAKTGQGVKDMFYRLAAELINRTGSDRTDGPPSRQGNIRLQTQPTTTKRCQC